MHRFDVLIPYAGPHDLVLACVDSVVRCGGDFRLVLFSNGTTSRELRQGVAGRAFGVPHLLLGADADVGAVKAHNILLAYSTAPYVVVLNDDTTVVPNWLERLAELFALPGVGVVAPCLDHPRCQNSGIDLNAPREGAHFPDYVDTQCVMLSREFIKRNGYFSEEFHHKWDREYMARARRNGFRAAVDLRVVIHHRRNSTRSVLDAGTWVAETAQDTKLLHERYPEFQEVDY